VVFDVDEFVAACQRAARDADPVGAVREVVSAAVRAGSAIDDVLGRQVSLDPDTLFRSEDLTVQRILWPGGSASPPHDHRMWAVVGVYAGRELNTVYERQGHTVVEKRKVPVEQGEVFELGADAVHSVVNPDRRWTAGLHVYGGDLIGVERSAWLPDGTETSQAASSAQRRAMVEEMRELATDRGQAMSGEMRFVALNALWDEVARRRRYLTPIEARAVIEHAWNPGGDGT
jgi:predicted metal-dependent enzyme (double-stranded beta helix superfamily)